MKRIFTLVALVSLVINANVIETIKQDNKIRIGIKYDTKPFGFKEGRKIKGFSLEFSKLIVSHIKKKYNLSKLKVFYKKVVPATREQMIIDKRVDMVIATYTITDKRKEKISFSKPYFTDRVVIVHRSNSINGPVGVLKGSTTKSVVEQLGHSTKEFYDYNEMFSAFDNAEIDAISTNESILKDYINSGQYHVKQTPKVEHYGIGLPKDDREFRALINDILEEINRNGEFDRLYRKWFK